ncbi:hypothetical protein Hanom_Chr14g01256621 [Helianthus anomalus]
MHRRRSRTVNRLETTNVCSFVRTKRPIWIQLLVIFLNWLGWFPFLVFDANWMCKDVYVGRVGRQL